MNSKRLSEKDPGETVPLCWDFTADLDTGVIVGTPEVEVVVDNSLRRNSDPSPSAMLSGSPQLTDRVVIQAITGGVDGVDYKVRCAIDTDGTPASRLYKTSILPVRVQ